LYYIKKTLQLNDNHKLKKRKEKGLITNILLLLCA